jgi:hypothetical protein
MAEKEVDRKKEMNSQDRKSSSSSYVGFGEKD